MVLVSETTRQLVMLELTVPWEDQMEEAFQRKRANYEELACECRSKKTRCNSTEVGCRGFVGQSLVRALKMLGVKGQQNRRALRNISDAAEKAVDQAGRSVDLKCYLDTSRGLITTGWVPWVRVSVVRPETPRDTRIQH